MNQPEIYSAYDRMCKYARELHRLISDNSEPLSYYQRRLLITEADRVQSWITSGVQNSPLK